MSADTEQRWWVTFKREIDEDAVAIHFLLRFKRKTDRTQYMRKAVLAAIKKDLGRGSDETGAAPHSSRGKRQATRAPKQAVAASQEISEREAIPPPTQTSPNTPGKEMCAGGGAAADLEKMFG